MDNQEDYELTLYDRLEAIRTWNKKLDLENNAYISFSGGKDSTILHYLIDIALPNNEIPRIFINTGIEYKFIVDFVKELAEKDDRFVILLPKTPVKKMLEEYGYPFKSKEHSYKVSQWKKGLRSPNLVKYATGANTFACPLKLRYQLEDSFTLKISSQCCNQMKKRPFHEWEKANNRHIAITGMRNEEGGQRTHLNCVTNKGTKFHPLVVVSEDFEEWFINKFNIQLCKLYYPPYNFKRTGCVGCPFSLELQDNLLLMEKILPSEYKRCEIIWKPVYQEYRRLNYRLKSDIQTDLFDYLKEED